MSDHIDQIDRGWAKFLDPESLRSNLIAASIFLSAYEILRASIVDQIRRYLSLGEEIIDFEPIASDDYRRECLALDKSPLRASLLWLKQNDVIDDDDIAKMDLIRQHRNALAHDLPKFLTTADADVNIKLLSEIISLVTKIDRWWIREFDIPSNPDFDGKEIDDEEMTSGHMIFIHIMLQIATGENSSEIWAEYQRQFPRDNRSR